MTLAKRLGFYVCLLVIWVCGFAVAQKLNFWSHLNSKERIYSSSLSHLKGKGILSFREVESVEGSGEFVTGRVLAQIRRENLEFRSLGIKPGLWGGEPAHLVSFSSKNEFGKVSGRLLCKPTGRGGAVCLVLVTQVEVHELFRKEFDSITADWDWSESIDFNVLES